jgi:hypothetical protein
MRRDAIEKFSNSPSGSASEANKIGLADVDVSCQEKTETSAHRQMNLREASKQARHERAS